MTWQNDNGHWVNIHWVKFHKKIDLGNFGGKRVQHYGSRGRKTGRYLKKTSYSLKTRRSSLKHSQHKITIEYKYLNKSMDLASDLEFFISRVQHGCKNIIKEYENVCEP